MHRKLVIALGIVAVVVAAGFTVPRILGSMMFRSRPAKPLPEKSVLQKARQEADRDIRRWLGEVDAYGPQAAYQYYDTGTLDECEAGEHNWKVDASFENRCRYSVTKYYGFDGDFRVAMVALDSALVAWGWTSQAGGLPSMLEHYYDPSYGPDKPKPANFPDQYLVQNIPGVSYTRGDAARVGASPYAKTYRLFIRYEETDPKGRETFRYVVESLPWHQSRREAHEVDTKALFPAMLEKHRYVLEIGIMADNYFVN